MHLKGALHNHTACSDGELSILETIRVYSQMGFDFIALTDHDYLMRPDCYNIIDSLETDLIIFKGIELTVFEKGYIHVNKIWGNEEVLHIFNHPAELYLSVEKVKQRISALAQRYPLDAIEVTSRGFRTPEFEVPDIPLHKIATDDSHGRSGCGRAWIEMDCARDKDSIIRAIKNGEFWNCYTAVKGLGASAFSSVKA